MRNISSFMLAFTIAAGAQQVKVSSGTVQRLPDFQSKYVDARNVDVWLPDGYSDKEKYAVLYMHDGQMLYDAALAWNGSVWEVDETAGRLMAENKTQKFIVVGIWNNGQKRHAEYFPQKPFESLTDEQRKQVNAELQQASGATTGDFKPYSDLYLKFVVKELKPYIEHFFSVKTGKEHTFIAGSSMGGLISMYAICEYPDVFGGAACLSTHWTGTFTTANNPIPQAFLNYLKRNLPSPMTHKIYFDHGDQTLDKIYQPFQVQADDIMRAKGFGPENWMTKFYPGADHSEGSWAKRLEVPLVFLLGK